MLESLGNLRPCLGQLTRLEPLDHHHHQQYHGNASQVQWTCTAWICLETKNALNDANPAAIVIPMGNSVEAVCAAFHSDPAAATSC
ncbi:hypothetical protein PAXRUDRAFT_330502 [Paxillus rubicundulus Ve08.2h10]|uniref:Unplaced genomic scaffold scaffold_18, whole genome shotgun sequence n=1 Tax=Paxillus rubicundulus Ve08.2h10 TaxID=930991 RepID=A0A0D0EAA3_9AGAM|nr:hypothetical protein PAXRUDRAFT_330502 [Paxillus rubicundulus Ve08.2h10]